MNAVSAFKTGLGETGGDAIGRALAGLYHRTLSSTNGDTPVQAVTTALFNLVVCEDGSGASARLASAAEVAGNQPGRVIALTPETNGDRADRVEISLVCTVSGKGDRRLCGEMIEIRQVPGEQSAAVISPLLAPDVPVFVWVGGGRPSPVGAECLPGLADYVIYDSRLFPGAREGLSEAAGMFADKSEPPFPIDLAWRAMDRWREGLARHFDQREDRALLAVISRATLYFAPDLPSQDPPAQALLAAGWLVSVTKGAVERPFTTELATRDHSPGGLLAIEIECGGHHYLTRRADVPRVLLGATAASGSESEVEPANASDADLISAVVQDYGRDRVYEDALREVTSGPWDQ